MGTASRVPPLWALRVGPVQGADISTAAPGADHDGVLPETALM